VTNEAENVEVAGGLIDLTLQEETFEMRVPSKNGTAKVSKWVMREMGDAPKKRVTRVGVGGAKTEVGEDGKVRLVRSGIASEHLESISKFPLLLIVGSLFELTDKGERAVTEEEVGGWPTPAINQLFTKAQRINRLLGDDPKAPATT